MRDRKEEIKRRIAKRKKQMGPAVNANTDHRTRPTSFTPDYGNPNESSWSSIDRDRGPDSERIHPLFNKETFIMKILAAAILVLIVAILFQNPSSKLDDARNVVKNVMQQEFQFAAVADWYENTFGEPLALLPKQTANNDEDKPEAPYALPANARILKDFSSENEGITIQTTKDANVEAVKDGIVEFAGKKEEFGNIVIIQHPDKSETWYGNLGEIAVSDYQQVKAGDKLGTVTNNSKAESGEFYFAVKRDEKFIDPIEVIKVNE